jgi:uncharacterized protein YkwD
MIRPLPSLRLAAALLGVVLLAALAACAPAPGTERMSAGRSLDIASAGAQLSLTRAGAGVVRPLLHSPALQAAAQAHADDLARTGRGLSHRGSDGSDLQTRLRRAGVTACAAAENLAQGTPDIRSTLAQWMASDAHRANILNPQVTQFGLARGAGGIWVLALARPC